MRATDTIARLTTFERRGAGTDAERRAARWLACQLESRRRTVRTQTFWCRPNWALAHAWHAALGLAGSLIAVGSPRVGGALLLAALVSTICDELAGVSLGRRLTLERASQNVVARSDDAATSARHSQTRLIITANYDAGRSGLAYRRAIRAPLARGQRMLRNHGPGWLAWLTIALAWLLVIAVVRLAGDRGSAISAAQLPPTIGLVLALALLIELASAPYGPAASDNGSGVGVALALAGALDVAPPPRLAVDVVLTGAGDSQGIGLRRYLRANRGTLKPGNTIVLGLAACGAGEPRWWISDGTLVPRRFLDRLTKLSETVAEQQPQLHAAPHRGRGTSPALRARWARRPGISIGCLDRDGRAPRSHLTTDTLDKIDPRALDAAVQFGLMLVDEIDAYMRERRPPPVTSERRPPPSQASSDRRPSQASSDRRPSRASRDRRPPQLLAAKPPKPSAPEWRLARNCERGHET